MGRVGDVFTKYEGVVALGMSLSVFVMILCVLYFAYEVSRMKAQDDATTQLDKEEEETWN